jgi:hypothetical protein
LTNEEESLLCIHDRMEIKSGAEFRNMKKELELELPSLDGSYSLSGYFLLLNTPLKFLV